MLKSAKLNKKYILSLLSIGLFGLGGLLLAPATMYIIKVSDNHPKYSGGLSLPLLSLQEYMDFCLRGNGIRVLLSYTLQ